MIIEPNWLSILGGLAVIAAILGGAAGLLALARWLVGPDEDADEE